MELLVITVEDVYKCEVKFKVLSTTKFKKIFEAHCTRNNRQKSSVIYKFNGMVLNENLTPFEVGMRNGDKILCYPLDKK